MSGDVEIIRTREVRGPGGRKARHTRAQESIRVEKPEIAKALSATNNSIEEVHKQEGLADSAPNAFVTNEREEVKMKVLRSVRIRGWCCALTRKRGKTVVFLCEWGGTQILWLGWS